MELSSFKRVCLTSVGLGGCNPAGLRLVPSGRSNVVKHIGSPLRAAVAAEAPSCSDSEGRQAASPLGSLAASVVTAACLLGTAPECIASELAGSSSAQALESPYAVSGVVSAQPSSPAPSLVASPLPSDATADLTAAVTQQVVAAALSPGASGDLGASLEQHAAMQPASEQLQDQMQQLAQQQASAVVEGIKVVVSEGIQGANLVENTIPAVGGAVPQSWLSNTPLCNVWQAYCSSLAQAPLPTKAATGIVGTFLGDLLAQYLAHYSRPQQQQGAHAPRRRRSRSSDAGGAFQYDPARCARLVAFSVLVGTPMSHYWYQLLDAAVMPSAPTAPPAVALKVLLDQGVQTPFGMALFFATLKLLEGRPMEVVPEVKAKLMPALIANYYVWPLAQLVNFTMVPLDLRILYVNVISIAWTAYISNMASGAGEGAPSAPNSGAAEGQGQAGAGARGGGKPGGFARGAPVTGGTGTATAALGPARGMQFQQRLQQRGRQGKRAGPTAA